MEKVIVQEQVGISIFVIDELWNRLNPTVEMVH
jgi:hypothetical protein